MAKPHIKLWEHVGLGLIVSWPSGVIFENQTGGTSCLSPEYEGVFVPLRNDCTEKDRTLVSPENDLWNYFTGPKWKGTGATRGIGEEDANFVDKLLQEADLFPAIRVDRERLVDSHEAWIYVTITGDESCDCDRTLFAGFEPYPRPGILTWQNSD